MPCHTAGDIEKLNSSNKPTLLPKQCSSIYLTYSFRNSETPSGFPLTH